VKAVILAGGFAKRLGELGKKTPKALLPIAGRPLIEYILDKLTETDVSTVFVSTNKRFEAQFREWKGSTDGGLNIELVIEPAMEEGQKLGSIGALQYLIDEKAVGEELLVINGDNLFDFSLRELVEFYREKGTFIFGLYDIGSPKEARKFGVVVVGRDGLVTGFEEKPERPKSTLVSTGIYVFPKNCLPLIKHYINEGRSPDRLGDLLSWLLEKRALHAFVFSGRWFDIGSPETYEEAQAAYGQ